MRRQVTTQETVWRGNLLQSIDSFEEPTTNMARFVTGAYVDYALAVEFGTGSRGLSVAPSRFQLPAPQYSPGLFAAINEWVMTKPVFYGDRTTAVAEQIAQKIAEEGTHPHPYMRPAWFKNEPVLGLRLRLGMKKAIRRS